MMNSQKRKLEKKTEQGSEKLSIVQENFFLGPIPDPAILEKYQTILPGLPERIVAMAEKEQQNRHSNDKRFFTTVRLSQYFAFFSIICILSVVVLCILNGNATVGQNIAIGTTGVVASIFLINAIKVRFIQKK
jgi:uncharacterized membrane protein